MIPIETVLVGKRTFDGKEWRKAFLHYLFLIWKGESATSLPLKIGGITLVMIDIPTVSRRYFAYGPQRELVPYPQDYIIGNTPSQLWVCAGEYDIPEGLMRFVKNDHIKLLDLTFGMTQFSLVKSAKRGELFLKGGNLGSTLKEATDGYM